MSGRRRSRRWSCRSGDREPSAADLQAHCASRLAGHKVPKRFEFVAELPAPPSGKLIRSGAAVIDRCDGRAAGWPTTSAGLEELRPRGDRGALRRGRRLRYHPYDEPIRGRDAIVDSWFGAGESAPSRDREGTYDASYRPVAIDGDLAVAVGREHVQAIRNRRRQISS